MLLLAASILISVPPTEADDQAATANSIESMADGAPRLLRDCTELKRQLSEVLSRYSSWNLKRTVSYFGAMSELPDQAVFRINRLDVANACTTKSRPVLSRQRKILF